jgi:predicted hydrolase (HD superfamily)
MINQQQCAEMIINVLKDVGIYDIIKLDDSIYVGGSLPSFIVSQQIKNKNISCKVECNDIDLYTTNYVKTLHTISQHLGNKMTKIKRTGVNVTFTIQNIPIQIVTSEFDSFYDEVLGNYDCTMVAVGFYPFKNEMIFHDNFLKGWKEKGFVCHYERSNPKRMEKLNKRAKEWYDAQLYIMKAYDTVDFRPYYKNSFEIKSLQDIVSPPNYVQLYYNKYKCIQCKASQDFLMCGKCVGDFNSKIYKMNKTKEKKITILGGVNGLGKIVCDQAKLLGNEVYVTSRNPNKKNQAYEYQLGKTISEELMEHLLTSDIIVLNAYSTLDNDEKIWTTTLDTFDEELALDKFKMNTIGYAKFLQQFVKERKEQIRKYNLTNNITMVFMDANESKFAGKLSDGKHLELNLAKTATKQIFYTNANLLASLGILTVCYDPGWLSYHGISVDKIESKSKYLIPPSVSVMALLYHIGKINFDDCISNKKVIYDSSVYEIVNEIKKFVFVHF